jgi:hypothetical protein
MFLSLPIAAQVRFAVGTDSVAIRINGKPFSVLHFGKEARKPYLHPLLTASGNAITRGFPVDPLPGDSIDHPNHRGFAIGGEEINGQDFWDNELSDAAPDKGTIAFQKVTDVKEGDERGTLSLLAHWISHEGKLWLIEHCTMTFYSKPADVRMFDVDFELEANEPVTFNDQQSAIMGLRLALPFDTHYDGKLVNAAGGVNEAGVRGRHSPWIDWTAQLNSGEKVGVAVFDHPANLNYPTRWQVRDKGYLMANPFGGKIFEKFDPTASGENAQVTLKRGDKVRLRYRIVIHPAGLKLDNLLKEFTSP